MIRITFLTVFCLFELLSFGQHLQRQYTIEPTPDWVREYPLPEINLENLDARKGAKRLHIEIQYDAVSEAYYHRMVYEITGPSILSSFNIDFQPAFQSVQVHKMARIRGGREVDLGINLQVSERLETEQVGGMLYDTDGRLKIAVPSLRIGDLFEIAYSIKGSQPDLQSRLIFDHSLYEYFPVGNIVFFLRYPASRGIQFQEINCKDRAKKWQEAGYRYFEMKVSGPINEIQASNLPSHFEPYCRCRASEFRDYEEMVAWKREMYKAKPGDLDHLPSKVAMLTSGLTNKEDKIDKIKNFVQDSIEYEDYGLYVPKSPSQTLAGMHGDCKSKSWLAVEMLKEIGVDAWPISVHSQGQDSLRSTFASSRNFDHVIVGLQLDEKDYFFDATMNRQFAGLKGSYLNDFGKGLFIREGVKEIRSLSGNHSQSIEVFDTLRGFHSGLVTMDRTVILGGMYAEELKKNHETSGMNAIREWLPPNFWKPQKPNINLELSDNDMDFSFEVMPSSNMGRVRFRSLYSYASEFEQDDWEIGLYPFTSYLPESVAQNRAYPFNLHEHLRFRQRLVIIGLKEKSPIPTMNYDRFGIQVDVQSAIHSDTVLVDAELAIKEDFVPRDSLLDFKHDLENISKLLRPKWEIELDGKEVPRFTSHPSAKRQIIKTVSFLGIGLLLILGVIKLFEIIWRWVRKRKKQAGRS